MGLERKDYHQYIKSEAWREKRRHYFASKMPKDCYVCGNKYRRGFHLHHRTYKRLGCERINIDLVPVCPECHEKIHQIQKVTRLHIWSATKLARKIVRPKIKKEKRPKRKRMKKKRCV